MDDVTFGRNGAYGNAGMANLLTLAALCHWGRVWCLWRHWS